MAFYDPCLTNEDFPGGTEGSAYSIVTVVVGVTTVVRVEPLAGEPQYQKKKKKKKKKKGKWDLRPEGNIRVLRLHGQRVGNGIWP